MYVPNSPYGIRKAKRWAQEKANETGRRQYLQFESMPPSGRLYVTATNGYLPLPNAPFWTFYPQKEVTR